MTEHPIARDNVIDNEYRYTALDGIYLPAADSDRIGHNEYDCRCHNARRERERKRREKEGRGVHYTEWPIATGRLYKTNNIGKINIEGKNRNPKD